MIYIFLNVVKIIKTAETKTLIENCRKTFLLRLNSYDVKVFLTNARFQNTLRLKPITDVLSLYLVIIFLQFQQPIQTG